MKKIVMFESPEDLETNFYKVKMLSFKSYMEDEDAILMVDIKIEPVVINNGLCDSLKFYMEEKFVVNSKNQIATIPEVVLYFWGVDPYCNEDVFVVRKGHVLYEKFKYLINE